MPETMQRARRSTEHYASERFEKEAANHRMRVFRDDGLYRHLRFTEPGTWCYGYDLITWPGQLAIAGDCGDYTFARIADMFRFFRSDGGQINPGYWSEKLTNRDMRDGTRRFDPDLFRPRVMEWYEQHCESYPDEDGSLRRALDEQVLPDWDLPFSREHAIGMLTEFEHDGTRIYEPYDWSLEDWDHQFIWCCWAIVQGIAQYDWAKGWR